LKISDAVFTDGHAVSHYTNSFRAQGNSEHIDPDQGNSPWLHPPPDKTLREETLLCKAGSLEIPSSLTVNCTLRKFK